MLTLEPLAPTRFRLAVTHDLCVGPPGNIFMFGGIGHAAGIAAMTRVIGREPVWSSAQFLSFAREGTMLDIEVTVAVSGRNISQASAVVRAGDDVIIVVSAAFGSRPGGDSHQWLAAPAVPPPGDCVEWPIWPRQGGGFSERTLIRLVPGSAATRPRTGRRDPDGRMQLWIRMDDDEPVDVTRLAVFGDFVPAAVAAAVGRLGGGNSLDNTLRVRGIVPTRWTLCDAQIAAVDRGFAHGDLRMFAEDGALLAVAAQSLIVRFLDE